MEFLIGNDGEGSVASRKPGAYADRPKPEEDVTWVRANAQGLRQTNVFNIQNTEHNRSAHPSFPCHQSDIPNAQERAHANLGDWAYDGGAPAVLAIIIGLPCCGVCRTISYVLRREPRANA